MKWYKVKTRGCNCGFSCPRVGVLRRIPHPWGRRDYILKYITWWVPAGPGMRP